MRPARREALALVVPGLKPGRTYSFRLIAYNDAGSSGPGRSAKLVGLGTYCLLPLQARVYQFVSGGLRWAHLIEMPLDLWTP